MHTFLHRVLSGNNFQWHGISSENSAPEKTTRQASGLGPATWGPLGPKVTKSTVRDKIITCNIVCPGSYLMVSSREQLRSQVLQYMFPMFRGVLHFAW